MIDYEKLKLAHELASRTHKWIWIETRYSAQESLEFKLTVGLRGSEEDIFYFDKLDDLIAKLQELTQPEPKYEDGQEVWLMYTPIYTNTMQPGKFKTDAHKYEDGVHQYCLIGNGVGLTWREENAIYPSREALIEAQIAFWSSLNWSSLKNEEKSTGSEDVSMESTASNPNGDCMGVCEHESNSSMPLIGGGYKCKKCGAFYR